MNEDIKSKRLGPKALLSDRRGSVATIFAVALVPVLIAAGVGLDISRAGSSRANLQDAVDATALALAHLPSNTPQTTLETKAGQWLTANLNDHAMAKPDFTVTPSSGQVVLTATSSVPATLTALIGAPTLPIRATSTVKWGLGHVEVALVLDNTGSMGQNNKLASLQAAAKSLVNSLVSTTQSGDPNALKFSVVPFGATVKIGSAFRGQTWIANTQPTTYGYNNNGPDIFDTPQDRFALYDKLSVTWGGCVESRPPPYDVTDDAPTTATPNTLIVPYFAPDEPDGHVPDGGTRWGNPTYYSNAPNNYLADQISPPGSGRTPWFIRQNNSLKYNSGIGSAAGPNAGCGMQSLLRLTTDATAVKAKISAMNASGNTNIPIGLAWGWFTLSPSLPFGDGAAYNDPNTKKFVVLLTDGDNTNDEQDNPNNSNYSALGYLWQKRLMNVANTAVLDETSTAQQRSDAMDARMKLACANIKAKGVTVYTVRIDVSGSASTALQNCASSADKYYDIDSSGLSAAFQNIAGSIGQLRISQ